VYLGSNTVINAKAFLADISQQVEEY